MIDPQKITKFNRTQFELEEFFVFCVFVAGKNSTTTAKRVGEFLATCHEDSYLTPFQHICYMMYCSDNENDHLLNRLKRFKIGQYARISGALKMAAPLGLDLKTATVAELETIPGVGPKTARFFVLHSRKYQRL